MEETRNRKSQPLYNAPRPTLKFLRRYLARFLPLDIWNKKYPGNVSAWLQEVVYKTVESRWLNKEDFEGFVATTKMLAEDLEALEKHVKENLEVFLREIIPPSVHAISVYDVVVFAEIEGKLSQLSRHRNKLYTQEAQVSQDFDTHLMVNGSGDAGDSGSSADEVAPSNVNIFISYSFKDGLMKQELDAYLDRLLTHPAIQKFDSPAVNQGASLNETVSRIKQAHIVLLLISPDYMNSKVCRQELELALSRYREEAITIIPVYLRPIETALADLDDVISYPAKGVAISNLKQRNKAYREIAVGLRQNIDRRIKS